MRGHDLENRSWWVKYEPVHLLGPADIFLSKDLSDITACVYIILVSIFGL